MNNYPNNLKPVYSDHEDDFSEISDSSSVDDEDGYYPENLVLILYRNKIPNDFERKDEPIGQLTIHRKAYLLSPFLTTMHDATAKSAKVFAKSRKTQKKRREGILVGHFRYTEREIHLIHSMVEDFLRMEDSVICNFLKFNIPALMDDHQAFDTLNNLSVAEMLNLQDCWDFLGIECFQNYVLGKIVRQLYSRNPRPNFEELMEILQVAEPTESQLEQVKSAVDITRDKFNKVVQKDDFNEIVSFPLLKLISNDIIKSKQERFVESLQTNWLPYFYKYETYISIDENNKLRVRLPGESVDGPDEYDSEEEYNPSEDENAGASDIDEDGPDEDTGASDTDEDGPDEEAEEYDD